MIFPLKTPSAISDQRLPGYPLPNHFPDLLQFHVDLLAGVVWRHASHEDLAIVLEVAQARLAEALHHHHGIEHGLPNLSENRGNPGGVKTLY